MEKQDAKHPYNSIYGSGFITAAQYLTEQLCAHVARQTGEDLIDKFWQLPKWKSFFRQQIPAANALLKEFDVIIIMKALRDEKSRRTYSFRAPHFIKLVYKYWQKEELARAQPKQVIKPAEGIEDKLPRRQYGKPTLIDKLL